MSDSHPYTTIKLIRELLNDPNRKSILRMFVEVGYLFFLYRTIPKHYFSRYLFRKDRTNIRDYLPNKFLYKIKSRFNEEDVREVLENKLYFDFYYNQFDFDLPKIIMYNHRNIFVVDKKSFEINSVEDFRKILTEIMPKGIFPDSLFIKKTYWSYGGDHIYKLYPDNLTGPDGTLEVLYAEVIKSGYLFQETVKQHPVLDALNPFCLNTIRFDTFMDKQGKIEIISGYLRTNIKNHYTDNNRVGGCEIPIDLDSGKLKKYGHLTLKWNGLKLQDNHPVSGIGFENFIIPHFMEAKALVIKAAGYTPGLRLVGWDVGIGESGPILIEGNPDYDVAANDMNYGGYRKNPVFQKVLKEINFR
jgi:hypothetical protein